jgi:hypothetical protein
MVIVTALHLQEEDGTFTFTNKDTNWVMELIRRIVKLFSFDIGIHVTCSTTSINSK